VPERSPGLKYPYRLSQWPNLWPLNQTERTWRLSTLEKFLSHDSQWYQRQAVSMTLFSLGPILYVLQLIQVACPSFLLGKSRYVDSCSKMGCITAKQGIGRKSRAMKGYFATLAVASRSHLWEAARS
jgi:hypothetical protein